MLFDAATIYIHWSVNQTATGWTIPLEDLEPANRMFTHGRGATTCSMYLQGNTTLPYSRKANQNGRAGDARFVFGVYNSGSVNANTTANPNPNPGVRSQDAKAGVNAQMAILAMYPYWNAKFGPATPASYVTAAHNTTLDNVVEISGKVKHGFSLSADGYSMNMAAAIPRSAVPWLPQELTPGMITGGDFSCNIKGFAKDWWINYDLKASTIAWDEPSEAMLCPSSWGNFSFKA